MTLNSDGEFENGLILWFAERGKEQKEGADTVIH